MDKKDNLILLESYLKSIQLNEDELVIKDKLVEVEEKLGSFRNIIDKIEEENLYSIFSSDSFNNLIGSIAIAKALEILEDYFELKKTREE